MDGMDSDIGHRAHNVSDTGAAGKLGAGNDREEILQSGRDVSGHTGNTGSGVIYRRIDVSNCRYIELAGRELADRNMSATASSTQEEKYSGIKWGL